MNPANPSSPGRQPIPTSNLPRPAKPEQLAEWAQWLAEVLLIASLYVLTGKLGFLLAMPPGNVTTVWIPSGLALAAILLRGYGVWPGIWLGSFLLNAWFFSEIKATPFVSFLMASNIAVGSSLQALIGAWFIQRWVGSRDIFDRTETVFKFLVIELFSCIAAPTYGVTALFLGMLIEPSAMAYTWWTWWVGDLIGVLVFTPLLIVWSRRRFAQGTQGHRLEGFLMAVLLAFFCSILFGDQYGNSAIVHPLSFLLIPAAVWAGFRFGQRGVTLLSFAVAVLAILGTIHGLGPFVRGSLNDSLSLLQIFVGTLTTTGLILAASLTEQRDKEEKLSELGTRKSAMLEVALDCVITADHDGNIIDFNPAAEETFGYPRDKVVGRPLAEVIKSPALGGHDQQGAAHSLKTGEHRMLGKRVETTATRANGREFPIEMSIHAVRTSGKSFFTAYLRDITKRKRTEEEMSALAAIVQSSDDAIIGKSLEGIILSWNAGAERIYGYRAEEVLGKHISLLIPPERSEELPDFLRRLSQGKHIDRHETIRIRKDGTQIDVALTLSPIKDKGGEVIGASTIARNITDRKRAEEALRASEERFRAFMDNSPAVAFIKDAAGRYVYANKPFLNLFGKSIEELKAKTDYDVWPADTAQQLRENDVAVLNANKTIQMVETVPTPDGVPHIWMVYKFPILDVAGQRLLGGVAVDVTERRKLEAAREQLRVQYKQAIEQIQTLSGFLPICASCKKIRDDKGYWQQVEDYISAHTEAEFSHGICPDCVKKLYPELDGREKKPKRL